MAFDTFDTDSVVTAGITFSNGNLTALGIAGSTINTPGIAQSVEGKTSGKWYVEFTCNALSGNTDGVGVVSATGIGTGFLAGANTSNESGWSYYSNGFIFNHGGVVGSVNATTWTTSNVIGVAIDLDNKKVWWRKNGGSWIGTTGTPDPATNTSGFDLTATMATGCRMYPAVNLSGALAQFTVNFGASAFGTAAPSGFAGWTNTTAGTYFGTFATTGRGLGVNAPPVISNKAVSKYLSTLTGTVSSIVVPFAGASVTNIKGVIYDDTGTGGLPGALLGVSTNVVTGGARGERTLTFTGVSVSNGSSYWVGVVSDAAVSASQNFLEAAALSAGIQYNSGTYASPTNPFGATPSSANFRYPIIINVVSNTSVNIAGVSATAAAGSFGISVSVAVALSGVAATAAAGSFGTALDQSISLAGVSATAATGSFSLVADSTASLSGVSATAAAGALVQAVSAAVALSGVQATAAAGSLTVNTHTGVYVPIITIMNENPIPVSEDMVDDDVPMEADLPSQIAFEAVINTIPIAMSGTLSASTVPGEGSVP